MHPPASRADRSCLANDFVAEQTHDGRKLCIMTIIDEYTKESLITEWTESIQPRTRLAGLRPSLSAKAHQLTLGTEDRGQGCAAMARATLREDHLI